MLRCENRGLERLHIAYNGTEYMLDPGGAVELGAPGTIEVTTVAAEAEAAGEAAQAEAAASKPA